MPVSVCTVPHFGPLFAKDFTINNEGALLLSAICVILIYLPLHYHPMIHSSLLHLVCHS